MSYDTLSYRQQQVMDLLFDGTPANGMRRNAWIAKVMNISERTVKQYLLKLFRAYGIPHVKTSPFLPTVRLVYERGRELGLIR